MAGSGTQEVVDHDGLRQAAAQPAARPGAGPAHRADRARRGAHLRHGPALQGGRHLRRARASCTSRSTPTWCSRTARPRTARCSRRASPRPAPRPRFQAAATSYATHGEPMIPFYIFYSMFGFQRTGDQFWAVGDARGRGFLLGATAGRTTLNGEGLQHEDGHSLLLASTDPVDARLRPGVRLRDGAHHPRRPAAHARGRRGRRLLPDPLQRELRHARHAGRASRKASCAASTASRAAPARQGRHGARRGRRSWAAARSCRRPCARRVCWPSGTASRPRSGAPPRTSRCAPTRWRSSAGTASTRASRRACPT